MYIFIHLFSIHIKVFTLATLVGYSALCHCACRLPGESCAGLEQSASGPGTWGLQCLWGRCCGSSPESHAHVVAGSLCIPNPPLCRCLSLVCLLDHCWSPAHQPCSRATHVMADLTQCLWKLRQGLQAEGPWEAVGTPRRSWAYVVPEPREKNNTI